MSTFAVKVSQIGIVAPVPNSDRLDVATLTTSTYQFVVGRGAYKPCDLCIYFPLDSVLPEWLITALDLTGKLSGKDRNRVSTVRLRGQISQGIVSSLHVLEHAPRKFRHMVELGEDLTDILGVTKYEPPEVFNAGTNLLPLPTFIRKYDIENHENYPAALSALMDQTCLVTEKLEGTNWGAYIDEDDQVGVIQRNYAIKRGVEGESPHTAWKMFDNMALERKLKQMKDFIHVELGTRPATILLRGELVGPGIQGNWYELPGHEVFIFDIEIDGQPVNVRIYNRICEQFDLASAYLETYSVLGPYLRGRTLAEMSNGHSQLNPHKLREGLVIRPILEQRRPDIGRLILKARSPHYLAKQS